MQLPTHEQAIRVGRQAGIRLVVEVDQRGYADAHLLGHRIERVSFLDGVGIGLGSCGRRTSQRQQTGQGKEQAECQMQLRRLHIERRDRLGVVPRGAGRLRAELPRDRQPQGVVGGGGIVAEDRDVREGGFDQVDGVDQHTGQWREKCR